MLSTIINGLMVQFAHSVPMSGQEYVPNFGSFAQNLKTVQEHPNELLVIGFGIIFLVLFIMASKKIMVRKTKVRKYIKGQTLMISENRFGRHVVHPVDIDPDKVVVKIKDGTVVDLAVSDAFQREFKTTKVVKARYIDPRYAKTPDGEKVLLARGFNFPDHYTIGPLTFEQIFKIESNLGLFSFLQEQIQDIQEQVPDLAPVREEPNRAFLTNT